jgi:hypothetical protein
VLEIGEYELAGHARHVAAAEAPVAVEYVPAEHPVHALALTTVENDPGAQFVHPPPDTYVPAAQPADTHTLEPAIDVLPDSHAVHAPAEVPEYVFAGQFVQVDAYIAPVAPEYFPAVHAVHVLCVLAPVAPEYFPAGQEIHAIVELLGFEVYGAHSQQ